LENTFWTALGASFSAAIVTTIGIYVIRRFERWGRENTIYFICFAAGVLISVSFLHIIPKAFSMNANAPIYLFTGYTSLHLFNRFINAFVCDKNSDEQYGIGLVPMLGIGFHSFIDGLIYSITFTASIFTGILAATMVLHEFPEGIITYLLLIKAGFKMRTSLLLAFLAAVDAMDHALEKIVDGDHRPLVADRQEDVANAPVICLLVSDISRFRAGEENQRLTWGAIDAGTVSQNISLFCAANGIGTRPRATMDEKKIREILKLKDSQHLMLNNPVSYMKQ